MEIVHRRLENIEEKLQEHRKEKEIFHQQKQYTNNFLDDKTKFIEIKETDQQSEKKSSNRRTKLTDEEIREERRRLQERAMKMNETKNKHVHFNDMDSDDEEIPHQQFQKIIIQHTEATSEPIGDSAPALFSHPGAIGKNEPVAFSGKMIERDVTTHIEPPPPKRISKFKASRQ
jgi:hypothetical protein